MKGEFQSLLSQFLLDYLPRLRGFSENTVSSYRDTIVLMLGWFEEKKGRRADRIDIEDINAENVNAFIAYLASGRGCATSTCNQRLSALKSFAKFVQRKSPARIDQCLGIIDIPLAKCPAPSMEYMDVEAIGAIIDAAGDDLRALALISLLYDSGARVSEIANLCIGDVSAKRPFTVSVVGKGRKARIIPVSQQAGGIVVEYIKSHRYGAGKDDPLFINHHGQALGRGGITYILNKYVARAHERRPDIVPAKTHPHALRHSKAMHLLEDGVNLVYIRDFLGHESVVTTEIYARANPEAKRKAIENLEANVIKKSRHGEKEGKDLLEWLKSIV